MTTNTTTTQDNGNGLYLPVVLAILLVLGATALVWVAQIRPAATGVVAEPTLVVRAGEAEGAGAAEAAPADMEAVLAAINKGGCIACHTIPDVPNAIGQVGPNLSNIGLDGAARRDGYSAEEYIRESIREPNAFIVPDCPPGPCIAGTMPNTQLNDAEVEAIVSFLVTLGAE